MVTKWTSGRLAQITLAACPAPAARLAFGSCSGTLEHRGEETIGCMNVGTQLQEHSRIEGDALLCKERIARSEPEFRELLKHLGDDILILFGENAACGVDEPSSGFDQPRGGANDRGLLLHELPNRLWRLSPFQVRVPAQSAKSAAGRIHQHPVDLACKPFRPRVILIAYDLGVDVRES